MLDADILGTLAEATWLDQATNCRMSETHRRALYWITLHSDTNGHSDLSPANIAQMRGSFLDPVTKFLPSKERS